MEVERKRKTRTRTAGEEGGSVGTAVAVVWLAGQFGLEMPPEVVAVVAGALSRLVHAALQRLNNGG